MTHPAAPESETPETDALHGDLELAAIPIAGGYARMLDLARSLERRLSLAQTEIKGHMRVEDDLKAEVVMLNGIIRVRGEAIAKAQARIAELEKALSEMEEGYRSRCNYCGGDILICAGLAKLPRACRALAARALKDRA